MFCPNCGQEQFCPCKTCKNIHKQEIVWKHDKTGNLISCGKCGLTAHADWWQDVCFEVFQLLKRNEEKNV